MPLPPIPENSTDRLWLYYSSGGGVTAQEHSFSIRYQAASTSPAAIMDELENQLDNEGAADDLFLNWQILRAENQAAGSQIRLAVTVPFQLLAFRGNGQATATPQEQAREVRYQGRGLVSGRRVSFSLYGVDTSAIGGPNFRFSPAPGTLLANLREMALAFGNAGLAFLTIAGDRTEWYNYVNWQGNSHWESEQRA